MNFQDKTLNSNIHYLTLEGKYWQSYYNHLPKQVIVDINDFLVSNSPFIQINPSTIINLQKIGHLYLLKRGVRVSILDEIFPITKKNLPDFIIARHILHQENRNTQKILFKNKNFDLEKTKTSSFFLDNFKNIEYIVRKGMQTHICLNKGDKKIIYQTLKGIEPLLKDNSCFIRIRRNYIINVSYLEAYHVDTAAKIGYVKINSKYIQVSRRFLDSFKKKYLHCFNLSEINTGQELSDILCQ